MAFERAFPHQQLVSAQRLRHRLTAAELRVLPLLSTHLSFAELGRELFLSPNTVKTQAVSLYRKLGVASRSQAVARAVNWGSWRDRLRRAGLPEKPALRATSACPLHS